MQDLTGKVALITGAGSGIGAAQARALAAAGARVMLTDRDPGAVTALADALQAQGLNARARVLDVTRATDWSAAREDLEATWGGLEILCNTAGIGSSRKPLAQMRAEDWDLTLMINLRGVTHGLEAFLPGMLARGRPAHILNIASVLGTFAMKGAADYSASKSAVLALSEALYFELQGSPVRVSAICPGLVQTQLAAHTAALRPEARPAVAAGFANPPPGIDASEVASASLAALRSGNFYIFTHNDYADIHAIRTAAISRAMARAPAALPAEDPAWLGGGWLSSPPDA